MIFQASPRLMARYLHPARCWEIHFVWTLEGAMAAIVFQESVMGNFEWCCSEGSWVCISVYIYIYICKIYIYSSEHLEQLRGFSICRWPKYDFICCHIFAWFHQHGMAGCSWVARVRLWSLLFQKWPGIPKQQRNSWPQTDVKQVGWKTQR